MPIDRSETIQQQKAAADRLREAAKRLIKASSRLEPEVTVQRQDLELLLSVFSQRQA